MLYVRYSMCHNYGCSCASDSPFAPKYVCQTYKTRFTQYLQNDEINYNHSVVAVYTNTYHLLTIMSTTFIFRYLRIITSIIIDTIIIILSSSSLTLKVSLGSKILTAGSLSIIHWALFNKMHLLCYFQSGIYCCD